MVLTLDGFDQAEMTALRAIWTEEPAMAANIYDQHTASFANVSAFVILDAKREKVATVAIKFPRDGAGRLYAYVHWLGREMIRGQATGYGYDKRSAACANAARKVTGTTDPTEETFWFALAKDGGWDWTRNLEEAGFVVMQAV